MRIALLQKNFHPNSIGLIRGLLAREHEVLNVVQYASGVKSGSGSVEVATALVGYGPVSKMLLGKRKKVLDLFGLPKIFPLFRTLQRFRPDVVIAKKFRVQTLIGALLARSLGATVVLMQNEPMRGQKHRTLAMVGRWMLPRLKFHTGHVGSIGEDARLGPIGTSRLLPYPIEPGPRPQARLDALSIASDRPVRIVTVGSLNNPRKRNAMLLEAIDRAGVSDRVRVTFIGLGTEESKDFRAIRELERQLGWPASEIVLNLRRPEVMERLSQQDLFVLPARNEPFGAVVPEAMSQGLPVICSDTCGARVCFEDGVSGFVFPTDSVESLGECIRRFVDDRTLLRDMAIAAHDQVNDQLTPERWAKRFEDLLAQGHRW